jgi:hypothetical protein
MRCIAGAAAAALLVMLLAGCGHSGPSEAACKKAMRQQYATALASGKQAKGEPAECKGLPDAVLQKLAGQVLSGQ